MIRHGLRVVGHLDLVSDYLTPRYSFCMFHMGKLDFFGHGQGRKIVNHDTQNHIWYVCRSMKYNGSGKIHLSSYRYKSL